MGRKKVLRRGRKQLPVAERLRARGAGGAGDAGGPFGGGGAGFRADLVACGTGARDRAEADVVFDAAASGVGRVDLPDTFVRRVCQAIGGAHYAADGDVHLTIVVARTGSASTILGRGGRRYSRAAAVDQQHEGCHGHECEEAGPATWRWVWRHCTTKNYFASRAQRNPMNARRASAAIPSRVDASAV